MPYVGVGEWIRSGISAFHRALDARKVVNPAELVLVPGLSLQATVNELKARAFSFWP